MAVRGRLPLCDCPTRPLLIAVLMTDAEGRLVSVYGLRVEDTHPLGVVVGSLIDRVLKHEERKSR